MGMRDSGKNGSRVFDVCYHGLTLKFELFTREYIEKELTSEFGGMVFELKLPEKNVKKAFKTLMKEMKNPNKHFAYIKFVEFNKEEYGVVGGKSNTSWPDISFDALQVNNIGRPDNRIARTFLKQRVEGEELKWSRKIVVVSIPAKNQEDKEQKLQAIFLERYLQRKFNLFDS